MALHLAHFVLSNFNSGNGMSLPSILYYVVANVNSITERAAWLQVKLSVSRRTLHKGLAVYYRTGLSPGQHRSRCT